MPFLGLLIVPSLNSSFSFIFLPFVPWGVNNPLVRVALGWVLGYLEMDLHNIFEKYIYNPISAGDKENNAQ